MNDTRSIPELVSDLTGELANLVRKEGELVRTEVTENLQHAAKAGQGLALGGALLLGAYLVLLQALVMALSMVMNPLLASIIVGVVIGATGYFVIRAAMRRMKPDQLAPGRSVRQLQKDAQLVKEQVR
jgi:drug/metabolite transporter (DMT)-like permease